MSDRIVESVPNFSEGRRPEVMDEIVLAIKTAGCQVLDVSSDESHNRTVVTFIGTPETAEEAAFLATQRASELIDMEGHKGEHPRIGATDVIPFIPVTGVTMADCVEMARRTGMRISQELGIPVYLYANAALRPDRVRLPDIRKGEYEGLKTAVLTDESRHPDFGPAKLHPTAGATAVGARPPLIAFNVNLESNDVRVARAIARSIRESSGGLPHVQAKGILLGDSGPAQVTMNILDYKATPVHVVYDKVEEESKARGIELGESEIIGLLPLDALLDCALARLKVKTFGKHQILDFVAMKTKD